MVRFIVFCVWFQSENEVSKEREKKRWLLVARALTLLRTHNRKSFINISFTYAVVQSFLLQSTLINQNSAEPHFFTYTIGGLVTVILGLEHRGGFQKMPLVQLCLKFSSASSHPLPWATTTSSRGLVIHHLKLGSSRSLPRTSTTSLWLECRVFLKLLLRRPIPSSISSFFIANHYFELLYLKL